MLALSLVCFVSQFSQFILNINQWNASFLSIQYNENIYDAFPSSQWIIFRIAISNETGKEENIHFYLDEIDMTSNSWLHGT